MIDTETSFARAPLISALLDSGEISNEQASKVEQIQSRKSIALEEALVESTSLAPTRLAEVYAERFQVPLVTDLFAEGKPDETLCALVSEQFARERRLIPVRSDGLQVHVAVVDPTDPYLLQETRLYTGLMVTIAVASYEDIGHALDELWGARDMVREMASEGVEEEEEEEEEDDEDAEEVLDLDKPVSKSRENQVIRLANFILTSAIDERASDVHLEQYPDFVKVRFRIDGKLIEMTPPHKSLFVPLVSRFKVLSKMDIAEKRVPQDGAFTTKLGTNDIDWRVSTVPTVFGEKMVMRVLNKSAAPTDLAALGFRERQLADFDVAAHSPHGLIFVTGPTGSGKSTTLYATLNMLVSPEVNIVTVEDPVEYKYPGIGQVQTKSAIGLDFKRVLRAFLRQDPDVIMVGEVRDHETAQICLRAALTGHLVLSTLHTNDAMSSIDRLADMGIEPFLIASTLRLIEAQRLIRRLCKDCKEAYQPPEDMIEKHQLESDAVLYKPVGCDQCRQSGYAGRVGVFEVVRITDELSEMITAGEKLSVIRNAARADGMESLEQDALAKATAGLTSLEEALRVTLGGH